MPGTTRRTRRRVVPRHGGVLSRAARAPEFSLLSGSFFICGASSNGIIGVHFVPHSIDYGIPEVTAAGLWRSWER